MTTTEQLNDPEYRWYHKEEMSKIMPFTSERNRLGILVLDYQKTTKTIGKHITILLFFCAQVM